MDISQEKPEFWREIFPDDLHHGFRVGTNSIGVTGASISAG